MRALPWNNPLVGTAFMLRARRGNLLTSITLYIVLLIMAMFSWQYYNAVNPMTGGRGALINPHKVFLLFLFGGQCFLSGILMLGQAGGAIKNEVMNKTLDFQRIASTGPWDILLGKLLGTPLMSYLLAISAIPVAVFSLLNGAPGVTIIDLFLLWLQILTFLFLLGSFAIQNTLQISGAKGTGASTGTGIMMAALGLITYSLFSGGDAVSYLQDPRRMTLGTLFSPLTGYAGISVENPWKAQFYWFDLRIPCLILAPVAHIIIAWFMLSIMARRLENIENTPLGKSKSYLMLLLFDLLAAGVLHSCSRQSLVLGAAGFTLQQEVAIFLLLHGVMSIIYFIVLTPRSDTVMSWIWRFRVTGKYVSDSLLHDRAPNTLPVIVNLLFAALGVGLLCLTSSDTFTDDWFLRDASATVAVCILFLGLFYQALHLNSRKFGSVLFILFIFVTGAAPVIVGSIMRQAQITEYNTVGYWILHVTPFSQILRWFTTGNEQLKFDVSPYPVIIAYGVFTLMILSYTRGWLKRRSTSVEATKARLLATAPRTMPSDRLKA